MAEELCYECGNKGKPGGCPRCGRDSDKLVVPIAKKPKEILIRDFQNLLIPDQYIGNVWSKQILLDNHPELADDRNFINFANRLEKLHNRYASGEVPMKSAYICAPSKMSKSILAYSCMQFARTAKITVAPILDTIDVKRLVMLSADNPKYKLYGIDYDKYIQSTVMFVSVTKTEKFAEALPIVRDLIVKRSRLGLPTLVISNYTLKEISQKSFDSDYNSLIDNSAISNDLKYPVIIEYKR